MDRQTYRKKFVFPRHHYSILIHSLDFKVNDEEPKCPFHCLCENASHKFTKKFGYILSRSEWDQANNIMMLLWYALTGRAIPPKVPTPTSREWVSTAAARNNGEGLVKGRTGRETSWEDPEGDMTGVREIHDDHLLRKDFSSLSRIFFFLPSFSLPSFFHLRFLLLSRINFPSLLSLFHLS